MYLLRIDEILRERGMTEKALAEKMGISPQSVNSVVRQRENTSVKKLQRYADALNVPMSELFVKDGLF